MAEKATRYMSSEEILKEYRGAKNKKQQITILADQNLCTRGEIIKILIEAGEDMECMKPKKGSTKEIVVPVAMLSDVILAALYEKWISLIKRSRPKRKNTSRLWILSRIATDSSREKGEKMAKKERKWELNRKQYQLIRKMDHQEMEEYLNAVYEKGIKAGQQQTPSFNTALALARIGEIKGIGDIKLNQIHMALLNAGAPKI